MHLTPQQQFEAIEKHTGTWTLPWHKGLIEYLRRKLNEDPQHFTNNLDEGHRTLLHGLHILYCPDEEPPQ